MTCVVCHTTLPADVDECPGCREPRVRICRCGSLVTIDVLLCPACKDAVPRVVAPAEQRQRRRRTVLLVGGGVLLAVAAVVAATRVPSMHEADQRRDLLAAAAADLAADRADAAANRLEQARQMGPDDVESLRLQALVGFARGDGERAAQAAKSAISRAAPGPAPAGLNLELARHHFAKGEIPRSLARARQAAEPEAAAVAARALSALGRHLEACAEYDRALASSPSDVALAVETAHAHAHLGEADWSGAAEHRARAEALHTQVAAAASARLASAPSDAVAARARALALATLPSAPAPEVDSACAQALGAGAGTAVRHAWADRMFRDGRASSVAEALGPSPGPGASPGEQVERIRLLARAFGSSAAEREFRDILAKQPTDPGAALALARYQLGTGRAPAALATIRSARVAGSRYDGELLECAAEASLAAGSVGDAEKHLLAWLEAAPGDPRPLRHLLDLRMPDALARIRSSVELDDRARSALARMDELALWDESDRTLLLWRVQLHDARGRRDDAARDLAALLAMRPDDADVRALHLRRAAVSPDDSHAVGAAAALVADPVARTSDLREFVSAALDAGRAELVIDVAAAHRPSPADAEFETVLCRALLSVGRPVAACGAPGCVAAPLRALSLALAGRAADTAPLLAPDASRGERIEFARALNAAGLPAAAAERLRAIGTADAPAPLLAALASAFEEAAAIEEARSAWAAADVAAGDDSAVLARWAVATLTREPFAEADRAVVAARTEKALDRKDGNPATLALRGIFLLAREENGTAATELRRASLACPERNDLRRALAHALRTSGHGAEADDELRRILCRDPAAALVRSALTVSSVETARAAIAAGRVFAACFALSEAAGLSGVRGTPGSALPSALPAHESARLAARADAPDAPAPVQLLAALDAAARGETARGESIATRIAESDRTLASALLVRAIVRRAAGLPDAAAADLAAARALGLPPDESATATVALTTDPPKPDEVAALRAAAEAAPDDPHRSLALARALERAGRTDAAMDEFERLAAAPPRAGDGIDLHVIGQRLAAVGRADPARRALRRALLLDPDVPGAAASRDALRRLGK